MNLLDDWLCGWVQRQRLFGVLIVHIVTDAYKLAVLVAAAQKDDGDTDDLAVGDS